MTILITNINSGASVQNVTTHAIASFLLPANRLGLISILSTSDGATVPPQPTIPNWTAHATILLADARRVTLFRRVVATDTTEALTVSFGGINQGWVTHSNERCDEFAVITGTNGADGIVQALGSGTVHSPTINATPTLTALAAFANVNNASFSYINIGFQANVQSVGNGFSSLSLQQPDISVGTRSQWKNTNDTVHELTVCSGSEDMFVGMAAEINHIAVGGSQGKAARLLM